MKKLLSMLLAFTLAFSNVSAVNIVSANSGVSTVTDSGDIQTGDAKISNGDSDTNVSVGDTLTVTITDVTIVEDDEIIWYADDEAITDQSSETLTITKGYIGKTIKAVVTITTEVEESDDVVTEYTSNTIAVDTITLTDPVIKHENDEPEVGDTLTLTLDENLEDGEYSIAWNLDGAADEDLDDETTLTLENVHLGKSIKAVVTIEDDATGYYDSTSYDSNEITVERVDFPEISFQLENISGEVITTSPTTADYLRVVVDGITDDELNDKDNYDITWGIDDDVLTNDASKKSCIYLSGFPDRLMSVFITPTENTIYKTEKVSIDEDKRLEIKAVKTDLTHITIEYADENNDSLIIKHYKDSLDTTLTDSDEFTYEWYNGDDKINGQDEATYTVDKTADAGKVISVKVTPTEDNEKYLSTTTATSDTVTIPDADDTREVLTDSSFTFGKDATDNKVVLTVPTDPALNNYTITWYEGDTEKATNTNLDYSLEGIADETVIKAKITVTDATSYQNFEHTFSYTVSLEPEEAPTPNIYFNGSAYTSSSDLDIGSELQVRIGDDELTEADKTKYTIQWFRVKNNTIDAMAINNGYEIISGANSTEYSITSDDIGYQISVGLALTSDNPSTVEDYSMSTVITESIQKEDLKITNIERDYNEKTITAKYKNGSTFYDESGVDDNTFEYEWSYKLGAESSFSYTSLGSNGTGSVYNYDEKYGYYKIKITPKAENTSYTTESAFFEIHVADKTQLTTPVILDSTDTVATEVEVGDTLKVGQVEDVIYTWYLVGEGDDTTLATGVNEYIVESKCAEGEIYVIATPNNNIEETYAASEKSDTVAVAAETIVEYKIILNGVKATISGVEPAYDGILLANMVYTLQVAADEGYTLPSELSTSNSSIASISNYVRTDENTKATFTLTAGSEANITGDVTITVNAIADALTGGEFSIKFGKLENVSLTIGNEEDTFNTDEDYTFEVTANENYILPSSDVLNTIISQANGDITRDISISDDGTVVKITVKSVKGNLTVGDIVATKNKFDVGLNVSGTGITTISSKSVTSILNNALKIELSYISNYEGPITNVVVKKDGTELASSKYSVDADYITINSDVITEDCTITITGDAVKVNTDLNTVTFVIDGDGIETPASQNLGVDDEISPITLKVKDGYDAETVKLTKVKLGNSDVEYTFDTETLVLDIEDTKIDDDCTITITVSADKDDDYVAPEDKEQFTVSIYKYAVDDDNYETPLDYTDNTYLTISDETNNGNTSVNNEYSFKLSASYGYQLPDTLTASELTTLIDIGAAISDNDLNYALSSDKTTATVTISNITSNLLVKIKPVVADTIYYNVTVNLSNAIVTTENYATTVEHGENYTISFAAEEDYQLTKSSVEVTVGGRNWSSYSEFDLRTVSDSNFDISTGELTVYGVEGDVVITVTAEEIPSSHSVWFSLWGLYSDGLTDDSDVTVNNGDDLTIYLKLKDGFTTNYELPTSIDKITNNRTGETLEKDVDYKYSTTSSVGTLIIYDVSDSLKVYASATLNPDSEDDSYEDDDEDDTNTSSTYTITFVDASGNTVTTLSTGTDKTLSTLPSLTTGDNIIFLGWYLSGGTKITTSTVFSDNRTVYAKTATVFTPTYNSDGNHYISTSNTDIAISAESLTGGTITVNSSGKVENFVIIPPSSGYATTTQTNIVLPDSNGNTVTWTVPAGSVIDDNNYLNLAVTVSESPIHTNSTIGRSLGYIDFAHDGTLLANYKSLTVTFRLYNVTTGDTIQINKLDDYNDITSVYVDGSAIGNSYIRANFYSCSRWEIFAKNYTYYPDGNGGGSYTQFFNIPTTGYISELRNVQLNDVIDLTKINVGNGLVIEGWYYDQAFTNRVSNPSYVVVSEAIIKTGLYPKYVSDYVTPENGNPYPDAGNGYLPDLSDNPTTSTTTLATLF